MPHPLPIGTNPLRILPSASSAQSGSLSAHEREGIEGVLYRINIPRNANQEFADRRTFGPRASDVISAFGSSVATFSLILKAH